MRRETPSNLESGPACLQSASYCTRAMQGPDSEPMEHSPISDLGSEDSQQSLPWLSQETRVHHRGRRKDMEMSEGWRGRERRGRERGEEEVEFQMSS